MLPTAAVPGPTRDQAAPQPTCLRRQRAHLLTSVSVSVSVSVCLCLCICVWLGLCIFICAGTHWRCWCDGRYESRDDSGVKRNYGHLLLEMARECSGPRQHNLRRPLVCVCVPVCLCACVSVCRVLMHVRVVVLVLMHTGAVPDGIVCFFVRYAAHDLSLPFLSTSLDLFPPPSFYLTLRMIGSSPFTLFLLPSPTFPALCSYEYLESMVTAWHDQGIMDQIKQKKLGEKHQVCGHVDVCYFCICLYVCAGVDSLSLSLFPLVTMRFCFQCSVCRNTGCCGDERCAGQLPEG